MRKSGKTGKYAQCFVDSEPFRLLRVADSQFFFRIAAFAVQYLIGAAYGQRETQDPNVGYGFIIIERGCSFTFD